MAKQELFGYKENYVTYRLGPPCMLRKIQLNILKA